MTYETEMELRDEINEIQQQLMNAGMTDIPDSPRESNEKEIRQYIKKLSAQLETKK